MEDEKIAAKENTVEKSVGENTTESKDIIHFKQPLLVGKIGRLPKKLNSLPSLPTKSQTQSGVPTKSESSAPSKSKTSAADSLIHNSNANQEETDEKETPNLENVIQKAGTFAQYIEPNWAGQPRPTGKEYNFEVLKDGAIIETINLTGRSCWLFGRTAKCHIAMHHPTVSRYHAVLQYRAKASETEEPGFYIYDLGSTHGTFLNKNRVRPNVYVRIQVGHMLKLGRSRRNYLLNGPEEDTEKESELTVTELKQKRREDLERRESARKEELLRIQIEEEEKQKREEEKRKKEEERGVDWGMGDDADEETDLSENPYAQTTNEELYLDDPKKTLRGYFEREGLELEYDCSEQGMGQFLCKVELPIDDERGRPIFAEVIHKGKKKDAVVQCALEACRTLDRHGLLRQAQHESRKRKAKDWAENDYYDSDDDTFLDRTGAIEKKREKRMNAKNPQKAETYESLLQKEQHLSDSIKNVEKHLTEAQQKFNPTNKTASEEDSLDAFMKDLKDSKPDKSAINRLKTELGKLKQEHTNIIKLVNIARPACLPPLVAQYSNTSTVGTSKVLPIFGKRKKVPVMVPQKTTITEPTGDIEEEEEELDDESVGTSKIHTSSKSDVSTKPEENEKLQISVSESRETKETPESGLRKSNKVGDDNSHTNGGKDKSKVDISFPHAQNSLLDDCQHEVNRLLDKLKQATFKISSKRDTSYREQRCQRLKCTVTQGINKILDEVDIFMEDEMEQEKVKNKIVKPIPYENPKTISDTSGNSVDQEVTKKHKNQRRIQQRHEKSELDKQRGYKEDAEKEDYNMWVPPTDQQGDGKTKLNEKYGY